MYESRMIRTKSTKKTKSVRFFRALSDETRVKILEQLRYGEQCVWALTQTFNTGQSRLSFHLRVLKNAGMVIDRPEGRSVYYTLNRKAIQEAEAIITRLKSKHSPMAAPSSHSAGVYVETLRLPSTKQAKKRAPRESTKRIVFLPHDEEERVRTHAGGYDMQV